MPEVAIAVMITLVAAYLLFSADSQSPIASLVDSFSDGGSGGSGIPSSSGAGAALPGAPIQSKVIQFAQAIAHAEGFGIPGTVPTRFHNPGDLGPGDCGSECISSTFTAGSNVCQLKDDDTGWRLLYAKLQRIFDGRSSVYNVNMTFTQFAQKYAGDWQNWVNNVTRVLGVTPQTTIREWLAQ